MRSEGWVSEDSHPGLRNETWGTQIVGLRSNGDCDAVGFVSFPPMTQ